MNDVLKWIVKFALQGILWVFLLSIRVDGNNVAIDMSLTSPGCPSGPEIMSDAERHLKAIPGVGTVAVNLVWSPFWSPDRIEPRVRAYLGF